MPFDHNDHYHQLLLRQLPDGARTALDVGCGTGRWARTLAAEGLTVDAVDPAAEPLEAARAVTPTDIPVTYHQLDVSADPLPGKAYDYISCLASLHHMPFETVTKLRDALAPDGVLVVLGLYAEEGATDLVYSFVAAPANLVAKARVAWAERGRSAQPPAPPTKPATMTYAEIEAAAAELLPGHAMRRLLFWRYLLTYRAPSFS